MGSGLGLDIEHLAADHAAEAGGAGEAEAECDADVGVAVGRGIGEDVEGEGQQAVAGENCGGLVERLVRGRAAAAEIVVVHGGEVVVDEAVAVDAFDAQAARKGASPAAPSAGAVSMVRNGRRRLPPPSAP